MLIITATTPTPPYINEVVFWEESINAFQYKYQVHELTNTNDWMGNCLLKPAVILRVFNKTQQDILWLDVDMRIRKSISLIEDNVNNYDFMCYERTECKMHNTGWHWNAGVVFFKQSKAGRKLLERWVKNCAESTTSEFMPEQKALHSAWHYANPKTLSLPETYNADWDKKIDGVVLEHLKVSRKYKDIINNGDEFDGVRHNVTIKEGRNLIMFDLQETIKENGGHLTGEGATYFYASDDKFQYLADVEKDELKVGILDTFDRWSNSTDFVFKYPHTQREWDTIIKTLTNSVG